ncbi:MAG: hypothetical protein ACTHOH_12020, partial [Lysobacteraceae bacterium]
MRKVARDAALASALFVSALVPVLVPGNAAAQAASVTLDCSLSTNHCYADAYAPTSPAPLKVWWSFDTDGTDAIFPQDCTNRESCRFWCPRYPGTISASVQVRDANNLLLGSATATAVCTQQDEVRPCSPRRAGHEAARRGPRLQHERW